MSEIQNEILSAPRDRSRFFTEGVRALAALYVVFHHAAAEILSTDQKYSLSSGIAEYRDWFFHERYAVDAFIVLSGFCLMLRVAPAQGFALEGGVIGFLKRRFLRIYPPYLAAIAFAMLMTWIVPGMREPQGMRWDDALPMLSPGIILSHLFLVHNWSSDWIYKICYPFWTIATEWQIYFCFPIFLFILRVAGIWAAVAALSLLGLMPYYFFVDFPEGASTWFASLFALGAATAYFTRGDWGSRVTEKFHFLIIAVLFCLLESTLIYLVNQAPDFVYDQGYSSFLGMHIDPGNVINDLLIGLIFSLLLAFCQVTPKGSKGWSTHPVTWFLQSRPLLYLGRFSYSLYLIHAPILFAIHLGLQSWDFSSDSEFLILSTFGVAASLLAAFCFSKIFEARRSKEALRNIQLQSAEIIALPE
jgi:peptidoglycan/LPS O-acetylase OafA/YrhL